ncbi:hypothetical protein HELRODRAFT_169458 [Helobdella robusta]|uniref:RING-type domain-containing protein n=1 Tax=Helobdella robusta TaxID=6412 RepID=T1F1Y8_HELRO|nr:hypothetical protein HELRODRAFT_169458 [Helobdella robusta]ESO08584.1 hypothetical protein HELRODRAFT_169458 [Helobdella robusta]
MDHSTEYDYFWSDAKLAANTYFKKFIEEKHQSMSCTYESYLTEHLTENEFCLEDIKEFAAAVSEDLLNLACSQVIIKNDDEPKSVTSPCCYLPIEKRSTLMKEMQKLFISRLPRENMVYECPYEGTHTKGSIRHTDNYFKADCNINILKNSYLEQLSINDSCPICIEEYEEGGNICQISCGHSLHFGCAAEWIGKRPVCPLCLKQVRTVMSTSIKLEYKGGNTVDVNITTDHFVGNNLELLIDNDFNESDFNEADSSDDDLSETDISEADISEADFSEDDDVNDANNYVRDDDDDNIADIATTIMTMSLLVGTIFLFIFDLNSLRLYFL